MASVTIKKIILSTVTLTVDGVDIAITMPRDLLGEDKILEAKTYLSQAVDAYRAKRDATAAALTDMIGQELL